MNLRTDLAIEQHACLSDRAGTETEERRCGSTHVHKVRIVTEDAALRMGKPAGVYVTLHDEQLQSGKMGKEEQEKLAALLADEMKTLLPKQGNVLVVGLGNRRITADALGSAVTEKLLVTRPLALADDGEKTPFRSVCALAPGVLGVTGIETAEIVRGVVDFVRPRCVVVIDALAAREMRRIGTTVQLTDTGICPGSGVGNHRMALNRETLGVPVIAVGVPMVVYASVILRDGMDMLLKDMEMGEKDKQQALSDLVNRAMGGEGGDMVVTPRDVDQLVGRVAGVVALGINMALQTHLSQEEILLFTHDHL